MFYREIIDLACKVLVEIINKERLSQQAKDELMNAYSSLNKIRKYL